MNKKTISAKPREASKAPLSPRGEAFIFDDSDLETIASRVRTGMPRAQRFMIETFSDALPNIDGGACLLAFVRAKARKIVEENGSGLAHDSEVDLLAKQLLEDYFKTGKDCRSLRAKVSECTSALKLPDNVVSAKTSDPFLIWLSETKFDILMACSMLGNVRLLGADRVDVLERLPRFAMHDLTEALQDIVREIARRFPVFAESCAKLSQDLEQQSKAYSVFEAREIFDGVSLERVESDVKLGNKIRIDMTVIMKAIQMARYSMPAIEAKPEDAWKNLPLDVRYSRIRERRDDLRESSSLTAEAALMQLHEENYMGAKELSKTPGGLKKKLSEAGLLGKRPKRKR